MFILPGMILTMSDAYRYDPAALRARIEERLGWPAGGAKDFTWGMLKEVLKDRGLWKLAHEVESMLRTGDHLVEARR